MSRWTTPARCEYSSASRMPSVYRSASSSGTGERLEDAVGVPQRVLERNRPVADDVLQQVPGDELHDDVRLGMRLARGIRPRLLAGVVDTDDRGVRHARRRLRLEPEPRAEGAVCGQVGLEDLDGDRTTEGQVLSAVHGSHATPADEVIDSVAARQHA